MAETAQGVLRRAWGLLADGALIPLVPLAWGRSLAQMLFCSGPRFSLVNNVTTDEFI